MIYGLWVAGALIVLVVMVATILGRTSAPPADPFPGEMFEGSYARHANTPEWVRMCEAKLEWRLKDFDWRKQNSELASAKVALDEQIARTKAALDASRAGKRCEIPSL